MESEGRRAHLVAAFWVLNCFAHLMISTLKQLISTAWHLPYESVLSLSFQICLQELSNSPHCFMSVGVGTRFWNPLGWTLGTVVLALARVFRTKLCLEESKRRLSLQARICVVYWNESGSCGSLFFKSPFQIALLNDRMFSASSLSLLHWCQRFKRDSMRKTSVVRLFVQDSLLADPWGEQLPSDLKNGHVVERLCLRPPKWWLSFFPDGKSQLSMEIAID